MDSKIEKLVKKGILIAGVLKRDEEGFVTVERVTDLDKLKEREAQGEELYYATLSMGRSIFTINENGEIENYKGVDSCLTGDENVVVGLTDTRFIIIPNPVSGSMHEISLRTEPAQNGKRTCEFRFKGTSPLEDLEEEADKNADLNKIGVKVPKIKMVREYSIEKAKKLGLPYHIPGDYSDLEDATNASDVFESRRRKEKIAKNQSIFYIDEWQAGYRPMLLREYFEAHGLFDMPELVEFIEEENRLTGRKEVSVEEAISSIDRSYSLGQRYGQAVRILGSPFRISDIQGFINNNDKESLDLIAEFTESTLIEDKKGLSFEIVFAETMGKNVAMLLNGGWFVKNVTHRQDFDLSGAMCDDSYDELSQVVERFSKISNSGKRDAMINEAKQHYLHQIHFVASTVKIIQDAMAIRGKTEDEIGQVFDAYVDSFVNNLDLEKIAGNFGITKEQAVIALNDYLDTTKIEEHEKTVLPDDYLFDDSVRDYTLEMAKKDRPYPEYSDSVINANKSFNDFYRMLSDSIVQKFRLKQLSDIYKDAKITDEELRDADRLLGRGLEDKNQEKVK